MLGADAGAHAGGYVRGKWTAFELWNEPKRLTVAGAWALAV